MTLRSGLIVAAVVTLAGCSKCGRGAATFVPVEQLLPQSAVGVVVVPSIQALGERLRILEGLKVAGFLGQLQGFASPSAFSDALVGQLGVDVRNPQAMTAAGIDGSRGLAAIMLVSGEVMLVLPVNDETKWHATIERISSQRFGAGAGGEFKVGEVTVKTFSPQQGKPPKLGYVLKSGFALVATSKGVPELATVAQAAAPTSLLVDEGFKKSLSRLPAEKVVFAFAPQGSPLLKKLPVMSALLTARLSVTGLALAFDAPLKGDPKAFEMLRLKPSTSLAGFLPKDAFLTFRYQGDPTTLAPIANDLIGPFVARAFDEGDFDVKREVLEMVKPGVVMALSLADQPPMSGGLPQFDVRTTNPFSYAHLSGVALVNSGDKVLPVLEKIAAVAPKFGATMAKVDRNGLPMYFTTYAAGEGVHFAPKGDLVFFGSPVQRIDELEAVDPAVAEQAVVPAALANEAVSVFIDLNRLATSVRELPTSAWGIGGFAIKATTVRWLDATDDLKAVTASVGFKNQALQANVALVLAPHAP